MVIQDTQCNGALPAVSAVLESPTYLAYLNLVNTGRFIILKDKLVQLTSTCGNAVAGEEFAEKTVIFKYRKLCNIPIEYNAAAGAITEIASNNIFVLAIAQNTVGTWSITCRFRFTD